MGKDDEFVRVDVGAVAAGLGCELTDAQFEHVRNLVEQRLPAAMAEHPPEALERVARAVAVQAVGEVLGTVFPDDPAAAVRMGIGLATVGAAEINHAITTGRYPEFSEAQRRMLAEAVPRKVEALIDARTPAGAALAAVREFARVAVRVVMGLPPTMN